MCVCMLRSVLHMLAPARISFPHGAGIPVDSPVAGGSSTGSQSANLAGRRKGMWKTWKGVSALLATQAKVRT